MKKENRKIYIYLLKNYFDSHILQGKMFINFIFFNIMMVLFALSTSTPISFISQYFLSIFYLNSFLSLILSLENLFNKDIEEGSFDLYCLINISLENLIFIRMGLHTLFYCIPFLLFYLMYSSLFHFYTPHFINLTITLLFLNSLSFLMTTLVIGVKTSIFLLYLFIFPLFIPFIVFHNSEDNIYFLMYITIFFIIITPIFIGFILKKNLE